MVCFHGRGHDGGGICWPSVTPCPGPPGPGRSWPPELVELARIAEEIVSGKAREEKATNSTELEEQSCTTRRESS